ncbi:unnamed protein product [Spirodela intermedia]|uniref:Uncharacterized protein n=1 Tax=Spirodela intermedia TaxID=51605 RepID=A0A7I8L1U0_SPIIN|nr:unnamed protein product [Spirodela intermedia]
MAKDENLPSSLLILWLLFFLLHVGAHPADQQGAAAATATAVAAISARKLPSAPPVSHQSMKLHPRNPRSGSREFRAEAHEVPSGPNPISNR